MKPWDNVLTTVQDDVDKKHALRGLAKMAYINEAALVDSWLDACNAIKSWEMDRRPMSQEIRQELSDMLLLFKSNLKGAGQ